MYKAILFDFFGLFCADLSLMWFQKAIPNHQEYLDAFHAICGRSDRGELSRADFYQALSKLTGQPVHAVIDGISREAVINHELIDIVRSLHGHYKLAIISNATREWIDEILDQHNVRHLFDPIVISAEVGMIKPDKGIFTYTLQKIGVQAHEAVFFDDRALNVAAANKHGIKSMLFTNNGAFLKDLAALGITSIATTG